MPANRIAVTHPHLLWSPYTWASKSSAGIAVREACMPGAYLRLRATGERIAIVIDGSASASCLAGALPVIVWSVDNGPQRQQQLTVVPGEEVIVLAERLGAGEHTCELHFRAGTLVARWSSSGPRLRLAGIELAPGGMLAPAPERQRRILGYGDSITEGVGVDGHFTSWQDLRPNNALGTWLPILATALEAEYGQLGTGGQGIGRAVEIPGMADAWHLYDGSGDSRLVEGRLRPEPDLIISAMGTNDLEDPSEAYLRWCVAVRAASPRAPIALVVPINGFWRPFITSVWARRRADGDGNIHLIDCPEAVFVAPVHGGACLHAPDGAHPLLLGQAIYACAILRRLTAAGLLPPS